MATRHRNDYRESPFFESIRETNWFKKNRVVREIAAKITVFKGGEGKGLFVGVIVRFDNLDNFAA